MKKIIPSLLFVFFACTGYSQVYVAVTGNDVTGTGTSANPYKTIVKGVQAAAAGATVYVSGGTYNEVSEIYISKALTLQKTGSTEVIVNASGRGTGSFKYMVGIVNTSNVTIDGITFANNIGNGSKGAWVLGSGSNITIKNCSFENIGWVSNNLSSIPPNSGTVTNAIKVEGNSATALTNITLLDNNVENCATGWGEAVTITGNVNGFLVDGNMIYDIANIGIVVAGNYTSTGAPSNVNQARNGTLIGNEVHHCMSAVANSAGIYLDGAINIRVEKNEVYQSGVGISVGGEQPTGVGATTPGGHVINNNLIYNNVIAGAYFGTNLAGNAIQNTKIFNNTFYKNRTGAVVNGVTTINGVAVGTAADNFGGEVHLQNINGATFKNNIVYASNNKKALVALSGYSVASYASDYNLYYRDGSTTFIIDLTGTSFNGSSATGSYSPAQFTTQTTLDANAAVGAPGFVNAGSFDFALTSSALAKNKGDVTYDSNASGTTDRDYSTRKRDGRVDIGCYEIQSGAFRTATPKEEEVILPAFSIYPNPASDFVNINFGKQVADAVIRITDVNGRLLMVKNVKSATFERIDIRSLKAATGLVTVTIVENRSSNSFKVLIR